MAATKRSVEYYYFAPGVAPFRNWRNGIADKKVKAAVDARIGRMSAGNFSDSEPIGEGASESKIDFGPGYRIYYGIVGRKILLLWGGDKSSQVADIEVALEYWKDFKERRQKRAKK